MVGATFATFCAWKIIFPVVFGNVLPGIKYLRIYEIGLQFAI